MNSESLIEQVLKTWEVHNAINLYLLEKMPAKGFGALPTGSRGRVVAEQFAHMNAVRQGWLHYHLTGKRPTLRFKLKADSSPRSQLRQAFRESGHAVSEFLNGAMRGGRKPRSFAGNAVRWMGYLISHESHHRGQIALALKQQGMRLPESVSIQGLWGKWIWGKD